MERRYVKRGHRAHLVPSLGGLSDRAICGFTVYSPLWDWYGTGDQAEIERAASLPLCWHCEAREPRGEFYEDDESVADVVDAFERADKVLTAAPDPETALSATPDRLLTTAAVGALLGIDSASVSRWANERGLRAHDRVRSGRSTVTHWSERAILAAALENPPRMRRPRGLTPPA